MKHLFPLALIGVTAVGCGSSSNPAGPADSGTPSADHAAPEKDAGKPKTDAGKPAVDSGKAKHDAGMPSKDTGAGDTGIDAGPPPTPTGATLDTGSDIEVYGITDDGYVIYGTDNGMNAVPVTGGTPVTIVSDPMAGAFVDVARVFHNTVLVWTATTVDMTTSTAIGTLSVWSHTAGTATKLSTASIAFTGAGSDDSTAFVYTDNASSDGATADLYGATVSTLAAPVKIATGISTDQSGSCLPNLAFSGASAVASFCAGTATTRSVVAAPSATWTPKTLEANANAFSVDKAGTVTAIATAAGQLEIATLATGTLLPIDTATALSTTAPALYLSQTDAFVLYSTAAGALKSSPVATATLTSLAMTNVNGIDAVSTDETWALVHNAVDMSSGLPADFSLASVITPGTPSSIVTSTVAAVLGAPFTADSKYVIYMSAVTGDDQGNPVGPLNAVATSAPGTVIPVAKLAGFAGYGGTPTDSVLTGSKIIYTDSFNADVGESGNGNFYEFDLSTPATAPTLLMTGADPGYVISSDLKYLVYTITFGSMTDGIYAITLP